MYNSQTRQLRQTLSMLNSMILSGEQHSATSEKMLELANNSLDEIESKDPGPIDPGTIKKLQTEVRNENWSVVEVIVDDLIYATK